MWRAFREILRWESVNSSRGSKHNISKVLHLPTNLLKGLLYWKKHNRVKPHSPWWVLMFLLVRHGVNVCWDGILLHSIRKISINVTIYKHVRLSCDSDDLPLARGTRGVWVMRLIWDSLGLQLAWDVRLNYDSDELWCLRLSSCLRTRGVRGMETTLELDSYM